MTDTQNRTIPEKFQKFLNLVRNDSMKYDWLYYDHTECFIERIEEAEHLLKDVKNNINLNEGTLLCDDAINNPLLYKHSNGDITKVYLIGTEHDNADTVEHIKNVIDVVEPSILLLEHPKNFNRTDDVVNVWNKFEGDHKKMSKSANKYDMRKAQHLYRNDKYCQQISKWGNFLSMDTGIAIYLANKNKYKLRYIDISDDCCEKKLGAVYDHLSMYFILKIIYGIDCVEEGLRIELVYQLVASLDLLPLELMKLDNDIGKIISPASYILGTHTRDIYMTHRLHSLCKGNPNKTIVVVVGACHTFGIRDFWDYNLPTSIANDLENISKTRNTLDNQFRKYGGSLYDEYNKINYKWLEKRV